METMVDESRALVQVSPATRSREGGTWLGEAVVVDDSPLWVAWEGAHQAWLESKRRRSGGPNTVRAYQVAFTQFFEWAGVAPWMVSPALVQNWVRHLTELELAETTVNLKLAALSSFYDFVMRRYAARTADGREVTLWPADRRNPFEAVERAKVSPYGRAKYPTTDEAKALLAVINTSSLTGKRDFALLYSILVTCRRSSEVLNMRWGDLQEMGDGNYTFRYRYKGGSMRRAVLHRTCYLAIGDYLVADGRPPETMETEDYVFVALHPERIQRLRPDALVEANKPISNSLANRILKKYARRVAVEAEKAHLHGLRHAGARLRVQQAKASGRGVDYGEIMSLLGHSSLAVTQIYSTTILEDPEDAGGESAAQELMPKGARRRRKRGSEGLTEVQGRLL